MAHVLQRQIPYDPLREVALPGISPLAPSDWLIMDDAYAGQMAVREALLTQNQKAVLAMSETARPAAKELLDLVVGVLVDTDGFAVAEKTVVCPDGRTVSVDWSKPLETIGRLIQEDICLLERIGDQHVLTGAVLCFPASWSLGEKFGKPLTHIHEPVGSYDANIAARVQRLFDGVRVGRPLWRKNALWYNDPTLFQPRTEAERRPPVDTGAAAFLRSERQCILKLAKTNAVVFSIHTFLLSRADVEIPETSTS